ncbi:MAG: hypothetical protein WC738_02405 [Candidatus Omnitrophota bacterium]|jgi:hypothetical protein
MIKFSIVFVYSLLSLCYLRYIDNVFYLKGLFGTNIIISYPFLYVIIAAAFIFIYKYFDREGGRNKSHIILGMVIILPLLYLLTELFIGISTWGPYKGNRGVYKIYAYSYCISVLSVYALSIGAGRRKFIKSDIILHLPVYIYFFAIESMLWAGGFMKYAVFFAMLFLSTFFFEKPTEVFKILSLRVGKIIKDEKTFLLLIFIIALAIRIFWGFRLLQLTGDRFLFASDDGLNYDPFAATIAQGGLMSKEDTFYWNGFGYWYFLAEIYKVFGLHNFKAAIIIQSMLGATVPILVYFIAKRVFNIRFVSIVAAMMVALNQTLIFLSAVIGLEALYIPLFTMAIMVASYLLLAENFDYKKAFIVGAVFGLANNARSELLLIPFILAFLIGVFMRGKIKKSSLPMIALSLFAGFAALCSIEHIVNFVKYGEFQLAHSTSLARSFCGNFCGIEENRVLDAMGFNPFRDASKAIAVFMAWPVSVLKLLAVGFFKRITIYFLQPNFGVFDPVYLVNPSSGYFFRYPLWVQFFEYIGIFTGIFFALKDKRARLVNLFFIAIAVFLSSIYGIVLVTNTRRRGMLIPIFIIFFAYGAHLLYKRIKDAYREAS